MIKILILSLFLLLIFFVLAIYALVPLCVATNNYSKSTFDVGVSVECWRIHLFRLTGIRTGTAPLIKLR